MTVTNMQIGKELEQMFRILDEAPELLQVVFDDPTRSKRADTGRQGLTAEQKSCAVRYSNNIVNSADKVVSFSEDHSDIIVKGQRDTTYGHKVFSTGGVSTLILDCLIEQGNPADSERYQALLLERQQSILGRMPLQVTADGEFASKDNLSFTKEQQKTANITLSSEKKP